MNNKINIAEKLKGCPKGMKLYSPLFGEVTFGGIDPACSVPIKVKYNTNNYANFTKTGLYYNREGGECLLFPSSGMRDWSKFFKRGGVVFSRSAQTIAIFEGWVDSCYTEFKTSFSEHNDGTWSKGEVCNTKDFFLATEFDVKTFISKAEKHYHGKYNPETLQVEPVKAKCTFKPFDKVLVRDEEEKEVWHANVFSHYMDGKDFPYACCYGNVYRFCIPYEGNEYLLGTTDRYTEGVR